MRLRRVMTPEIPSSFAESASARLQSALDSAGAEEQTFNREQSPASPGMAHLPQYSVPLHVIGRGALIQPVA